MTMLYDTFSANVRTLIHGFEIDIANYQKAVAEIDLDTRYNAEYKEKLIADVKEEMNGVCNKYTEVLKTSIRNFCDIMKVKMPENEPENVALSNVLKIIEMTGSSLTADILREAMKPLEGCANKIRMIDNILVCHAPNIKYDPEVRALMDNMVLGLGDFDLTDYFDLYNEIQALQDASRMFNYTIRKVLPRVYEVTSDFTYSVLKLPDDMKQLGVMYNQLAVSYPQYFTKSMKTD